jgi:acyl-CoA hydrolase
MTSEGKRIADSRVTLSSLMGPQDTNGLGNVHGGVIMKMVDEAAALAAMRHARRPCVTVTMDSMTFMEPIRVGMLVLCNAELTYAGRTSVEVRVEVVAENPLEGTSHMTNTAYLVFVALDESGSPTPVPPLIYENEQERARGTRAKERQAYRKQQRIREVDESR